MLGVRATDLPWTGCKLLCIETVICINAPSHYLVRNKVNLWVQLMFYEQMVDVHKCGVVEFVGTLAGNVTSLSLLWCRRCCWWWWRCCWWCWWCWCSVVVVVDGDDVVLLLLLLESFSSEPDICINAPSHYVVRNKWTCSTTNVLWTNS